MIRLATSKDGQAIADVIRPVYDEYGFTWDGDGYMADINDVEKHYFSLGGAFWIWEEDGTPLGVIGLEVFPTVPGKLGSTQLFEGRIRVCGADCSLERLYVLPEARRKGVGSQLAKVCMQKAADLSRRNMEIWSDKRLDKAHKLYQSFGAKAVGERICHDPDQSPEWGLLLPLKGSL